MQVRFTTSAMRCRITEVYELILSKGYLIHYAIANVLVDKQKRTLSTTIRYDREFNADSKAEYTA